MDVQPHQHHTSEYHHDDQVYTLHPRQAKTTRSGSELMSFSLVLLFFLQLPIKKTEAFLQYHPNNHTKTPILSDFRSHEGPTRGVRLPKL